LCEREAVMQPRLINIAPEEGKLNSWLFAGWFAKCTPNSLTHVHQILHLHTIFQHIGYTYRMLTSRKISSGSDISQCWIAKNHRFKMLLPFAILNPKNSENQTQKVLVLGTTRIISKTATHLSNPASMKSTANSTSTTP
jgi:hypothetical protein